MTIVDFLNARLDEDERDARDAEPGPWWTASSGADWGEHEDHYVEAGGERVCTVVGNSDENGCNTDHIARHDPARVLAEVEAKRHILDAYEALQERRDDFAAAGHRTSHTEAGIESYEHVVRALAAVYADHPDYDAEKWAP